ncbi:acyl-CoA dehydrogenase family protein [Arthrobacter sp. NPDC089319]|uniref:acyl-CoA dehydrogenase family protein n=1 Tax=Arthrobacter sp. NPDC089319 TaxID=3155915 RepID=UPI0034122B51
MSLPSTATAQIHDLLLFETLLDPFEREVLEEFRSFLTDVDDAMLNDAWENAEFPFELVRSLAAAGQLGRHLNTGLEPTHLLRGMLTAELARKDASLATFAGVSGSLFGLSVRRFGSPSQQARILPAVASGELVGAFALTEPGSGSDIAGGMTTTARQDGTDWVINGCKRWIGNATWGHQAVVWAKEQGGDGRFLGFIVPTDSPGWSAEKIEGKFSLRTVQNAHITLTDVRVPDTARLPGVSSFRHISEVLKSTRLEVAWTALGNALGAFDAALSHAMERHQFGRPLARFQLVQDLLVRSEVNITSSVGALVQAARLADRDELREEHASLVKLMAASQARQTVALCREVFGGNGIVLENKVMKHFMDAEAIYTFEGTHQINTLIVGRALTGSSAFA